MAGGFQGRRDTGNRRFQQRHYEAVARSLSNTKCRAMVTGNADALTAWERVVEDLASMFDHDSHRSEYGVFKRDLFYRACAYEGKPFVCDDVTVPVTATWQVILCGDEAA